MRTTLVVNDPLDFGRLGLLEALVKIAFTFSERVESLGEPSPCLSPYIGIYAGITVGTPRSVVGTEIKLIFSFVDDNEKKFKFAQVWLYRHYDDKSKFSAVIQQMPSQHWQPSVPESPLDGVLIPFADKVKSCLPDALKAYGVPWPSTVAK